MWITRRSALSLAAASLSTLELVQRTCASEGRAEQSGRAGKILPGVNVAGAEFGEIDGKMNFQYVYATNDYINWCFNQGFRLIRMPFKWPRLMPSASDRSLRSGDISELRRVAEFCTSKGGTMLLDMHDYGRYREKPLGKDETDLSAFARTWGLLAEAMDGTNVWFGLMNEPHDQDMDRAMSQFEAAAKAIRATGHEGRILVPSADWSGAHAFTRPGNIERFRSLRIAGEWSIELHQYLDHDNSGTHHYVAVPSKGATVLTDCTRALRENGWTAVLGEYGWADTPDGNKEGADLLQSMLTATDVWIAHAYWAAGPWWGNYPFAIGPDQGNGQLRTLQGKM